MVNKSALIIGVNSQDGSYMADFLFEKGYQIYGTTRDKKNIICKWKNQTNVNLIELDYTDFRPIDDLINKIQPDEIYNFAALTSGKGMYSNVHEIYQINAIFVSYILESIRLSNNNIKFFQSSSREVFGIQDKFPQNEKSNYAPRSPYGAAKLFSQNITKIYRDYHNLYSISGILYNHESPRRGDEFVSKKIIRAAVRIKLKIQDTLILDNLESSRDWGYACDFIEAIWLIMQNTVPKDYIIATGKEYSVRDFCHEAFSFLGINYKDYVKIDKNFDRKYDDRAHFVGDISQIFKDTGWKPKTEFKQLVQEMVSAEMHSIEKDRGILTKKY